MTQEPVVIVSCVPLPKEFERDLRARAVPRAVTTTAFCAVAGDGSTAQRRVIADRLTTMPPSGLLGFHVLDADDSLQPVKVSAVGRGPMAMPRSVYEALGMDRLVKANLGEEGLALAVGLKAMGLGIAIRAIQGMCAVETGDIAVHLEDYLWPLRAYFDPETVEYAWGPWIEEKPCYKEAWEKVLAREDVEEERKEFAARRKTKDEAFFRYYLAKHFREHVAVDLEAGTVMPEDRISYLIYQARRSPGRDFFEARPRQEYHLDLIRSWMARLHNDTQAPLPSPAMAMDVGCRDGWLIAKMVEEGWAGEGSIGVELSLWSAQHARRSGRPVVRGDAHELSEWGREKFDWITILHALEHCHDPKRVLREARRALRNSCGRVFVIVPLERGSVSVNGDHCLMFRTPGDLAGMMTECGFEVEKIDVLTKGSELLGIGRRQG